MQMSRKFLLAILILQLAWAARVEDGCEEAASDNVSTSGIYSFTIEDKRYCPQCNHSEDNPDSISREHVVNNTIHSKEAEEEPTKCGENLYLKVDSGTTSCVAGEDCGTGSFPGTDSTGNRKCISCSDSANGGIEHCSECSLLAPTSRSVTVLITCSKCSDNNLSPLGDKCLRECPFGTYDNGDNVCARCHESCASCNNSAEPASCTSCYPGFVLDHAGRPAGTCIPECTGRYAENCEAGQCTAVVGTSKYCSKCKTGYVPVDGICVSTATREVMGCTPGNDGTCTACTGTYFLQSGGCYQSTAYPGMRLCEQAQDGKCTKCANLQAVDKQGSCPLCETGCDLCGTSRATACQACFPGYYHSGTKCFKCTDDSDESGVKITGAPNCVSCEPPNPGKSGPVTCYVTQQPNNDNTGWSMNSNALSPGAITGISITVILIIGGVAGFLCWWFFCHKKK